MASGVEEGGEKERPIFRDIRRYYCDYCGICRSKKSLIRSHVLTHHKEEIKDTKADEVNGAKELFERVPHTCQECGASFRKLAYLKQHMQSHSLEAKGFFNDEIGIKTLYMWREALDPMKNSKMQRGITSNLEWTSISYRRNDHLTRHLLKHEGKIFTCPIENCNRRFALQGNMKRHVRKKLHDDKSPFEDQKQHICQEVGCGKTFKYASKLKKHADSHVMLDYVDVLCCEPGCLKPFANAECLKIHIQSCHHYVQCKECGSQQLKKNFSRHQRVHEGGGAIERIRCSFKGCQYTFSNRSNLSKHVKAVHLDLRPFICRFSGCGQKFPYKHVRDNHEKSGAHVYVQGDFIESDEQLHSRPRGGRKRKCLPVETLMRKRVVPPSQASLLDNGTEYLSWLLSDAQ